MYIHTMYNTYIQEKHKFSSPCCKLVLFLSIKDGSFLHAHYNFRSGLAQHYLDDKLNWNYSNIFHSLFLSVCPSRPICITSVICDNVEYSFFVWLVGWCAVNRLHKMCNLTFTQSVWESIEKCKISVVYGQYVQSSIDVLVWLVQW